jgi:hypothetical protein
MLHNTYNENDLFEHHVETQIYFTPNPFNLLARIWKSSAWKYNMGNQKIDIDHEELKLFLQDKMFYHMHLFFSCKFYKKDW